MVAQPLNTVLDGVDVLSLFLRRIGVIEAQIGVPQELIGEPEIQVDGLGVANMQVAVRFGRKARLYAAAKLVRLQVMDDDVADEIRPARLVPAGRALRTGAAAVR